MARGKTVYLRSESGRVEDFDQFRDRIKTLGNPENLRFNELRQLLRREAQPLVQKARQEAYNGLQAKTRFRNRDNETVSKDSRDGFYNLYKSIDVFPNKGEVKAYVVVGLRGKKKKGAYYAKWQLEGGTKKNFKAKKFIDAAIEGDDVPAKAQKVITNFVQKRIKAHLR
jgi:hypothetical protein